MPKRDQKAGGVPSHRSGQRCHGGYVGRELVVKVFEGADRTVSHEQEETREQTHHRHKYAWDYRKRIARLRAQFHGGLETSIQQKGQHQPPIKLADRKPVQRKLGTAGPRALQPEMPADQDDQQQHGRNLDQAGCLCGKLDVPAGEPPRQQHGRRHQPDPQFQRRGDAEMVVELAGHQIGDLGRDRSNEQQIREQDRPARDNAGQRPESRVDIGVKRARRRHAAPEDRHLPREEQDSGSGHRDGQPGADARRRKDHGNQQGHRSRRRHRANRLKRQLVARKVVAAKADFVGVAVRRAIDGHRERVYDN